MARARITELERERDEGDLEPEEVDTNEEVSELIERTNYRLGVEAAVIEVPWFQSDKRAHAHAFLVLAGRLGLNMTYDPITPGDTVDDRPNQRRWTFRRVTLDDIADVIGARPGLKFEDLVDALYREPPWTAQMRASARAKLRTALFRLKPSGRVTQRFDEAGVERWQPANVATGLKTTPAGPLAPVSSDERYLPRTPIIDRLEAATVILRKLKVFSDEVVGHDPTIYVDLVRQIYDIVTSPGDPTHAPKPATP